ncbi:MAG: hypothetical protein MK081_00725 [Flavobacteriales bacterium]|nr:hypothetical protein [Flavobacteriales bacterium]
MRKEFEYRILQLTLLAIAFTSQISAQSTMSIKLSAAPGYRDNIFNSPDIYIRDNSSVVDTLKRSQLIVSEPFLQLEGTINMKWLFNAHRINWKTHGEVLRYQNTTQANATEAYSKLSYDHKPKTGLRKGAHVRLRTQDRLGLNVLGSELLTPFSFNQVDGGAYVERQKTRGNSSKLEVTYSYKNYEICFGCDLNKQDVSLTQREWGAKFRQEIKTGVIAKRTQKIGIEVHARDRRYFDWINYELLQEDPDPLAPDPFFPFDPNITYTARRWRYIVGQLDYAFPMSKQVKVKPFIEYTRRFDISNGDFSYVQWQPGIRFYVKTDNWKVNSSVSYTSRDYDDRLAREAEGVPFPTLEYTNLRANAKMMRRHKGNRRLRIEGGYASRESNTTEITTRVRRSYTNAFGMLGIQWSFERDRSKQVTRTSRG